LCDPFLGRLFTDENWNAGFVVYGMFGWFDSTQFTVS